MLFHEPAFLFVFLPVVLAAYLWLCRSGSQDRIVIMLGGVSLLFYAWWDPRFVPLIVGSIVANFVLGSRLQAAPPRSRGTQGLLAGGITLNLLLLIGFKYAAFIVETFNAAFAAAWPVPHVVLPLGISFFTFLQIAYLVDSWRGEAERNRFAPYLLFVTFFPHLIAGPLIHHREMIPQFRSKSQRVWEDLAVGVTLLAIGLFKKLVFAEQMALWSDSVFDLAATGAAPTFIEAWIGSLAFTFQIYFDFSGYSDMAIGLSRMFGIRLPVNFASPYKARDIIDFWRRWHLTLSRFFRDYLYIPLGGNRLGGGRRYTNLMIVMLLAGLWHGANWKFVVWGGLHGAYLMVNHGWHHLRDRIGWARSPWPSWSAQGLTFLAVVMAWVPFRAQDLHITGVIWSSMLFAHGVVLPTHYAALPGLGSLTALGVQFGAVPTFGGGWQLVWLATCLGVVWLLPNSQEILRRYEPALGSGVDAAGWLSRWLIWEPGRATGVIVGLTAAYLCFRAIQGQPGEFIYFRF